MWYVSSLLCCYSWGIGLLLSLLLLWCSGYSSVAVENRMLEWLLSWDSEDYTCTLAALEFLFLSSLRCGTEQSWCFHFVRRHFTAVLLTGNPGEGSHAIYTIKHWHFTGLFLCTPPVFCSKITQRAPRSQGASLRYAAIQSSQWKKAQKDFVFIVIKLCSLSLSLSFFVVPKHSHRRADV